MNISNLVFLHIDENGYKNYKCPMCGGVAKVHESVFYGRCEACLATIIDYKPAPHQVDFHKSKAKFRLNIGGFGISWPTATTPEGAFRKIFKLDRRSDMTVYAVLFEIDNGFAKSLFNLPFGHARFRFPSHRLFNLIAF